MTVESVHVNKVYPHTDSRYECVEATVGFAVDPDHHENQRIVPRARRVGTRRAGAL